VKFVGEKTSGLASVMADVKVWLVLIVFISGIWVPARAADTFDAQYTKAVNTWEKGDSSAAIKQLVELTRKRWSRSPGPKAIALLIEYSMRNGQGELADEYIERFLQYFPSSPYKDRVMISKAIRNSEKGDFFSAAEGLSFILNNTENKVQYHRARQAMIKLIQSGVLTYSEKARILRQGAVDNEVVGNLLLALGRDAAKEKRYKLARYFAQRLLQEKVEPRLNSQAEKLISDVSQKNDGMASILILAPMTGTYADFGTAMLQGALLAYEQSALNGKVKFDFIDTEGDPVVAIERTRERVIRDSVTGIIGPVLSSTASAVAIWLSSAYPDIPMITPTATDEGIARLGDNVFQFNVPTGVLAKKIAGYSMDCLELNEFAILAPNTDYGRIMASNFRREVEAGGGAVVAQEYFEEGGQDYQTQFNLIRARRYDQLMMRRRLRSGSKDIHYQSPKHRRGFLEDSVLTFPGFFIPASIPEDAAMLSGQYTYNKLDGTLLGSSGWYGRPTLKEGRKSVQGAFFSVAFLETSDSPEWQAFRKKFVAKWNTYPQADRVSGLSYDAVGFLLNYLKDYTGAMAVQKMRYSDAWSGVYGKIKIDPQTGENLNAHIVKIEQGKFVLSDECPEPENP